MANVAITRRVAFFGTPDIIVGDKDPMFTRSKVGGFRRDIITLQTVIPGHRQSLRATDRRNRYCKDIAKQITVGKKRERLEVKNGKNMHLCVRLA